MNVHHNTYQNAQRGRASGNSFGNRQTGNSANFDGQRKKRKTSEKVSKIFNYLTNSKLLFYQTAKRSSQQNQERKSRDPNGVMIPPIDSMHGNTSGLSGLNNSNGQNRSNSRGNP